MPRAALATRTRLAAGANASSLLEAVLAYARLTVLSAALSLSEPLPKALSLILPPPAMSRAAMAAYARLPVEADALLLPEAAHAPYARLAALASASSSREPLLWALLLILPASAVRRAAIAVQARLGAEAAALSVSAAT